MLIANQESQMEAFSVCQTKMHANSQFSC